MYKRENYLKKIRPYYDSNLIKVITGIRRSGKSFLLKQIKQELLDLNIDNKHIIYIDFEDYTFKSLKDPDVLFAHMKNLIKNKNKYYLLFDEIQMVEKWQEVIASLRNLNNTSIFITGSNSKLLSGELATLLTGRHIDFKVYPLTFKEVIEFKQIKDSNLIEKEFLNYIKWGGLPQRFDFNDDEQIKNYLSMVLNDIIYNDVVKRFRIKNITLFERIIEYVSTNPGIEIVVNNLTSSFKANKLDVSTKTIYCCLDYCEYCQYINRIHAYDIRGKRILARNDKYYLTDLGLANIFSLDKKKQIGLILENIVFNELVSRGYSINIGKINNLEIDFIATKNNEKEYYQVAYLIPDDKESKIYQREFGSLTRVNDSYPKFVLSMDKVLRSSNGIKHINIIDWLLNK